MTPGTFVVYAKDPDLFDVMEVEMILTDGRLSCRVLGTDDHFDFSPHELEVAPGELT